MKILAITVALLLSSTAFAQTMPPAEPTSPTTSPAEMPPMGETSAAPPAGTSMPVEPSAPPTTEAPMTSDATPTPPAPQTQMPTMGQPTAMPAPAPQAEYPRCSRTVVDQCIQSPARERDTKRRPRRSR